MITKKYRDTFMKILSNGNMIAFIQKNMGMGFARSICNTNAKPAIK